MPKFDLTRPCKNCPFRKDIRPYLPANRCEEILNAITSEQRTFSCHETTGVKGNKKVEEQHCAGATILLEKIEKPNQWMRWMERLYMYDHNKLDMNAPVYDSLEEMQEAYDGQDV